MSGAGTSSATQQQQQAQNSVSAPWIPSQGLLTNILGQAGQTNPTVTPEQTAAYNNFQSQIAGLPNFVPEATAGTGLLMGGGNANAYAPMAMDAYSSLKGGMSPFTSSSFLDPMSNPYLSTALGTMKNDISNSINSQFASAGRDLSPANSTAVARGESQGLGGLLMGQFNQDVGNQMGALNSVYGAGNNTTGLLSGMNSNAINNMLSGFNMASAIPGLATAPGQLQIGAANAQAQQPFQNLGWLSSIVNPIAAMGGQNSGSQQGNISGTQTPSTLNQAMGWLKMGQAGMPLLSGWGT